MNLSTYLNEGDQLFLPHISVDTVIIGYEQSELKVLLLQFDEKWTLPGGHVGREESVEEAAARILHERAGLSGQYLKLFQVFGDRERNFGEEMKQLFAAAGVPWREDLWINKRHISIAFYALVDIAKTQPTGGVLMQPFGWHSLHDLPPMWMDHATIAEAALTQLQRDITIEQISFKLLPVEFTMPQLHQLHEKILGKKLERSRFQKKMLGLDIFERLPHIKRSSPGRRPFRYRFKESEASAEDVLPPTGESQRDAG
ncbi:MAG: NUDIX domain-containing protein [Bacteroidota bacterium]